MPTAVRRPASVWLFVLACFGIAFGLGALASESEFAHLEFSGALAHGRVDAVPLAMETPGGVAVDLASPDVSLLLEWPEATAPAQVLHGDAALRTPRGIVHGRATLEVEETGTFLSGRLALDFDGTRAEGGLRVRLPEDGAASQLLAGH